MLRRFGFFIAKSNITQRKGYNKKRCKYQSQNICVPKSCKIQIHRTFFLSRYAKYKKIILVKISNVNIIDFKDESIPGKIGETVASPNQNTEKLINHSENIENQIGFTLSILFNVAKTIDSFNGLIDDVRIYSLYPS